MSRLLKIGVFFAQTMKWPLRNLLPLVVIALSIPIVAGQEQREKTIDTSKLKPVTSADFVEDKTLLAGMKLLGVESKRLNQGTENEQGLEEVILTELRGNRLSIQENEPFSFERIEMVGRKVKDLLFAYGYVEAVVTPFAEPLKDGRARLFYAVKIGDITEAVIFQFNGTRFVGSTELISVMNECMERGSSTRFLDRTRIDYCAEKDVRSYLFSKGLLKSTVRPARFESSKTGVFVSIDVDEGDRFVWGKFDLVGNKAFSKQQILDALDQTEGELANARLLTEFFEEKLKNWYTAKGYAGFWADLTPRLILPTKAGMNGTANVKIEIHEGRQYKVEEIRFVGVDTERRKKLLRRFSLKMGDIYVPSKLDADINKLNERKEFLEIDRNINVDFLTDDERANIVIVINLYPLN